MGPVTAPSQEDNIIFGITAIERGLEAEGEPWADLPRDYVRSYRRNGLIVTAFFGRKPNASPMTKGKAYEVIEAILRYIFRHNGAREILVSKVRVDDKPVATFALRFDEEEQRSRETRKEELDSYCNYCILVVVLDTRGCNLFMRKAVKHNGNILCHRSRY